MSILNQGEEIEAVRMAVLSFNTDKVGEPLLAHKKVPDYNKEGHRLVKKYNCQGCHLIENRGGQLVEHIGAPEYGPPNLHSQGRKTNPNWLIKFLYEKYNWINALMLGYALFANGENFKYELSMSDIESVQLSHYKKGQFYSKHVDFNNFNSNNAFTRKLSMSIQLSHENSYEGGDLLLYYSGDVYRTTKSKGSGIVFDSRLTHEVTPITKGERYSLVKWVHGDKPLA